MVISHAFCNDNFQIFDTYKPIMTERLIVHTRGYCFYYFILVRFIFQLLEYDIYDIGCKRFI